ncbi:MAG: hypothetical protein OEW75_13850 [Cyclobacteriaceae bacterium]|nr:hypothetical protein [Cyclobacteriaceae bacterium]
MIVEFEVLEQEDIDLLLKTPLYVSILIAGADGKIDKNELNEAISLSKIKQTKARKELIEYYKEVGNHFEDKLKVLINSLPSGHEQRNKFISDELTKVGTILTKIDNHFAKELYVSLKDMAKKVAEASGGILGYMSVGYEESKFVDLKMIKDPSL